MFLTRKKIILASNSPRRQQFFKDLGIDFQLLNVQKKEFFSAENYIVPKLGILGSHDGEERPFSAEKPMDYAKRMVLLKALDAMQYLGFCQDISLPDCFGKARLLQELSFSMETYELSKTAFERADLDTIKKHQHSLLITADTIVTLNNEILGKPKSKENALAMLQKLKGKSHAVITAVGFVDMTEKQCFVFCDKTDVHFMAWSAKLLNAYVRTGESLDKAGSYGLSGLGAFLSSSINGCFDTVVGLPVAKCVEFLLWNNAVSIKE